MNGCAKLATDMLDAGIPVMLMGAPGTAKTAWAHQRAAQKNAVIEVMIGSGMDRTDIFGTPVVADGAARFMPPAWARNLIDSDKAGKRTILLLDEVTSTPEQVQAPLLRLIQERRCADWALPDTTEIILAANPPEIAAGGWDISAPLANRIAHVAWHLTYDDWATWMLAQPTYREGRASIVGFLRARQALLLVVPKDNHSGAWPSPRSWDNASRIHNSEMAVASLVGSAAASEYLQWIKAADLPDPKNVLDGKAKLPDKMDARYATLTNVTAYAIDHDRTKDMWKIIHEVSKKHPDIVISPARALIAAAVAAGKELPEEVTVLLPMLREITKQ